MYIPSTIRTSCIVAERDVDQAVRSLHRAFALG